MRNLTNQEVLDLITKAGGEPSDEMQQRRLVV